MFRSLRVAVGEGFDREQREQGGAVAREIFCGRARVQLSENATSTSIEQFIGRFSLQGSLILYNTVGILKISG